MSLIFGSNFDRLNEANFRELQNISRRCRYKSLMRSGLHILWVLQKLFLIIRGIINNYFSLKEEKESNAPSSFFIPGAVLK